jgi:hypothetical protein
VNVEELERFGRMRLWSNFKAVSRNSPGGTEENHENFNQDSLSQEQRIEPETSRIGSMSVNHSTTKFGFMVNILLHLIYRSISHFITIIKLQVKVYF